MEVSVAQLKGILLGDVNRLRASEGYLYAGAPRYHTLFGRDSLISAWQMLRTDPAVAKATLRVLASFQGRRVHPPAEEEPGKILHEHRFDEISRAELPGWEFPYFGSVDATPLFLILGEAYVRWTGDAALKEELWDAFCQARRWLMNYGDADGDGYVEYERKNPVGLFHQGWKDGLKDHLKIEPPVALVEVQGYAYAAHRAFASMAGRDYPHLAQASVACAERIRRYFDRDFWLPQEAFFALGLDRSKRPRRAITSNPGHLLFTGVLATERVKPLVERLFRADMWTPYGIRSLASSESDFSPFGYHTGTIWPHDNWFLYMGLREVGFRREAGRIKDALLRAREELGRIPECYAVVENRIVDLSREPVEGTQANPLQAWASAALLDMLVD